MEAELARHGFYLDGIAKKLRLLNPEFHQLSSELIEECVQYVKDSKDFKVSSAEELTYILGLKKLTESQKMEMIWKRSRLLSVDEQKHYLRTRMYKDLKEKRIKLEKIKQLNEAFKQHKVDQDETIQMLCRR